MAGLSGALSGLSAAYPSYVKGRQDENNADMSDLKLADAKRDGLAKIAMGNALMLLGGGPGGNTPSPTPGQPSMSSGGGGAPPGMPPGGAGAPPSPMMPPPGPGGPQGPQAVPRPQPQGFPPMQGGGGPPPFGGQPSPFGGQPQPGMGQPPQRPPMGGQPPGGGMGGQQPMTWQSVLQAVQKANPGLPPDVAAQAVTQFLPMMNQQSQMEWRMMTLQIREQQLTQREQQVQLQEQGKNTRADKAETGRTQRTETVESGRNERTDRTETGRTQRAETLEGGRNTRADKAETGRTERSDANRQQRADQFGQREQRLERSLKLREDSTWARLEQQKTVAQQKVEAANGKQGLAEWRAVLDAQHKHTTERIQAYAQQNTMSKKERQALLDEADADYKKQLDDMRTKFGRSTPGGTPGAPKPGGGKDETRVPAAGAAPATALPKPGDERDGYTFKGGDPADPKSWEKRTMTDEQPDPVRAGAQYAQAGSREQTVYGNNRTPANYQALYAQAEKAGKNAKVGAPFTVKDEDGKDVQFVKMTNGQLVMAVTR